MKNKMVRTIQPVLKADVKRLSEVSRITFTDTFGAVNSSQDLRQYLDDNYSESVLSSELDDPNSWFYYIKVAGEVAGYLKLNVDEAQTEAMGVSAMEIQRIYLLPTFKRQGLGTELVNWAVDKAKEKQKNELWLGVWENNVAALAFYQKLGFKEVGAHVFSVGDSDQRDLVLKKELGG
ncbi:N-acetyltransferase [uncultured Secundilactobacillus sp.]|uniref:GNAT family N-acetyltransferase n=1 Tax=uncultured Secundilactobacillus sp. TaxID=2813935 RepID=UPI002589339F|nr:GNAT family N-acetyltransferase [uncultured Secundilactobacillus sp.]